MSASDKLLVTLENGIKRITINRPERRNALDGETMILLREEIRAISGRRKQSGNTDRRGRLVLRGR